MEKKQKKIQKKILNIFLYILIYSLCFVGGLLLIDVLYVYPDLYKEGSSFVTFFGFKVAEQILSFEGNSWNLTVIKDPVYDYIPFILATVLFAICLIILTISKRIMKRILI